MTIPPARRRLLASVIALPFLFFCAALLPAVRADATPPDTIPPFTLSKGRDVTRLYAQLCANCHGEDLRGNKTDSLLDDHWKYVDGSDDAAIAAVIRDGLPRSGMPGFAATLNEAEVLGLVVLIRETARRSVDPVPQRASALPEGVQHSERHAWRFESVAEGRDVPWGIAFLPDGRLLFTERTGKLYQLPPGATAATASPVEITGIPRVWVRDEGGLMAVVPHPDYAHNGWIYLTLSDPGDNDTGMTKIVRGRIRDGRWTDEEPVFAAPRSSYTDRSVNFGSRIVFEGDYMFFTVGEHGATGQAQDLALPNGKVHRTWHDGRVPPDNPFVHTPGAYPSIWSYGHRNPQGLARNPADGGLWSTEHGPRGGDELNYVRRGANYGWPVITYGVNYDGTPVSPLTAKEGMEQPVKYWTPSIAVSPIHFYTGDAFPMWKGNLFLGSLAQQELHRYEIRGDKIVHEELVFKNLGRIRDIATGPAGELYISLELPRVPGRIVRLLPAE